MSGQCNNPQIITRRLISLFEENRLKLLMVMFNIRIVVAGIRKFKHIYIVYSS